MKLMNQKKVFIISGFAPSLINFRFELLKLFVARGYEVVACAPEHDAEVIEKLNEIGVRYVPYTLQRNSMSFSSDIKTIITLYRIYKHEQPDLCFHYTIKPVIYGSFAACLSRVPSVYSMITGLGYAFIGQGWKKRLVTLFASILYRLALQCNTKVFFQNPDDRQLFCERSIVKEEKTVLVNGSGVDLEHFSPQPIPPKPHFLMVARLLKEKGVYEYIAAARLVKQKYPDVMFSLAGWIESGPSSVLEEELKSWTDEGSVTFLGKLGDVRPALAACSVYVLPSYREGTPRTVLEAMAMGRAVITTDVPGCRETVKHEYNGLLTNVMDATDLAKQMVTMIENPNMVVSMGEKSLRMVKDKYDVHQVNGLMLQVMGSIHEKTD